jgi:hypothetical protein
MPNPDWTKLFGSIDVGGSPSPDLGQAAQPHSQPIESLPSAVDPPQVAPGVFDMAASFTTSMARFAAGGFRTVPHDIYQARFAHCLACEQYDLGLCKLCGCYLDAKVRLPHEECPLKKWPAQG